MQSFIFWYKDQTGHVNQAGETVTRSLPHKLSHSQSCYAYIGTYIYIYTVRLTKSPARWSGINRQQGDSEEDSCHAPGGHIGGRRAANRNQ